MNASVRMAAAFGLAACLAAEPGWAGPASSDVAGQVLDDQGNPVVGASLTFTNVTDANITYSVKTDKKGRFSYSGLLYVQPGMWKVSVKADGLVPSKVHLESKTSAALIANEDSAMKYDGTPFEFPLKAFGMARLDLVMIPADKVPTAAAVPAPSSGPAAAPDDPMAQAVAKLRAGDAQGSLALFEQAVAAKPDDAGLHLEYAKVLLQLERFDAACTESARAIELAPEMRGPHRILASAYAAQDDYARAYAEIQKEKALAPDDPGVLSTVARLAELAGKPAEAVTAYEAVVAVQPDNTQAWVALGSLYAKSGQVEKSESAYRKLTALDPAHAYETFFRIGAAFVNKPNPSPDDMRKAVDAFRKSVELKPDFGPANKQLVYSLLNLGEFDQARTAIECYVKVDAKSADAIELQGLLSGLPSAKK